MPSVQAISLTVFFCPNFGKGTRWVNLFLSLNHKRKGYGKANITPYMHVAAYHVGFFLEKYGNMKQFSGQGINCKI